MMELQTPNGTRSRAARRRQAAGFTTTEVTIASFISAVVVGGVLVSFSLTTRHFKAASNYGQIHREGRWSVDNFSKGFVLQAT